MVKFATGPVLRLTSAIMSSDLLKSSKQSDTHIVLDFVFYLSRSLSCRLHSSYVFDIEHDVMLASGLESKN